MPFLYEFYLNKVKLTGIEYGFSTSRKWEEALDEAKLAIPFYTSDIPFSQYGLLEIEIQEVDNYTDLTEIATETLSMLIISDRVSLASQYGIYKHEISAIEYTAKLDTYIMASLAKTRSIESRLPARFEITTDGQNFNSYSGTDGTGDFTANVWLPPFQVKQTYFLNREYTFSQVAQAYQITNDTYDPDLFEYARVPTVFRTYNVSSATYSQWYDLSADDVAITFTAKGKYWIEYGLDATTPWQDILTTMGYVAQEYAVYRFYFSVIDEYQVTIYDILNSVRQNVSKGGGIESLLYFDATRIFDIDATIVTYLQSVPAPQMYLENATARQMLIFALSYINALPRLEYGETLDTLGIEQFNLSTGVFTEQDSFERSASQNTNQIGSRSYAPLKQVLPNDMDEATLFSPSQSGYQQVRATDLQITDSTFAIRLPKEIYEPKELIVYLPKITFSAINGAETTDFTNLEIPLTSRLINIEEWKLKYLTDNFPTITALKFWDTDLGLRNNMVDNLYWEVGSKKIHISDVYGALVNKTLIQNVINLAIYEYLMLNMPTPFTTVDNEIPVIYYRHRFVFDLSFLTDIDDYKDLRFRFSYLALQDIVTKSDKEDLDQINFYSEMRQNQDESIINVVRSSRKNYGDLQRTGNRVLSFQKLHRTLGEQYLVGMKDVNDYTITTVNRSWFANYFLATYFITKYHNRESRQTIVDQTYRWRDNYAKTVLNRHEHYGDYLTIYPPYENDVVRASQLSKVFSNDVTNHTIFGLILGETITDFKTKATVALIRTDGMFETEPETSGNYYAIAVPVSSYPLKQGFAFTFGFDGNQVAGDGLVERGTNWYNQAVRYTNESGRFSLFGFSILKDFVLDTADFPTYPKITRATLSDLSYDLAPYFWCRNLAINGTGIDSLVVDKDPMTNYNQTYQLNVISYYVGLYIIGQAFFNNNFIVNNPDTTKEPYLYLYDNSTVYELFEDLKVKSGYETPIKLDETNIEYDSTANKVSFIGSISLTGMTSWAIGDIDGNLYIACNEALNGFLISNEHFRTNIKEIGYKDMPYFVLDTYTAWVTSQFALTSVVDGLAQSFGGLVSDSVALTSVATGGIQLYFSGFGQSSFAITSVVTGGVQMFYSGFGQSSFILTSIVEGLAQSFGGEVSDSVVLSSEVTGVVQSFGGEVSDSVVLSSEVTGVVQSFGGEVSDSVTLTSIADGGAQMFFNGLVSGSVALTSVVEGFVQSFGGSVSVSIVFSSVLTGFTTFPTTLSPVIDNVLYDGEHLYWRVTNMDNNGTAVVITEIGDPTPDAFSFNLAYGDSHSLYYNVSPEQLPVTIYCTAQVSGKEISATIEAIYNE